MLRATGAAIPEGQLSRYFGTVAQPPESSKVATTMHGQSLVIRLEPMRLRIWTCRERATLVAVVFISSPEGL
jgi:hypothetical protein